MKGFVITFFWTVVFFFAGELWAATPACTPQVAARVGHLKNKWAYQSDRWGAEIRPGNETQFVPARTRKAALLFHGYGGSPFEMTQVAEVLHSEGYTTLSVLIPGFGSTASVANRAQISDWRQSVTDSMDVLSACYSEIVLVGFSTGGTLITDFLIHNKHVESDGTYKKSRISGVILLSPFYRFRLFWSDLLLSTASAQKSVNVRQVWNLTHMTDLKPFIFYPDFYSADLPTVAGEKIATLGKDVETAVEDSASVYEKFKIRSLTVITHADLTADPSATQDIIETLFKRPGFLQFGLFESVPHHVMSPVNPRLESVLSRIRQFVAN